MLQQMNMNTIQDKLHKKEQFVHLEYHPTEMHGCN